MEQLKENLEAFSLELPEEAVADINDVYKRFRDPPTSA
jgi:aryl-alcohol dehydrogenase-like predicted oxidoreductase